MGTMNHDAVIATTASDEGWEAATRQWLNGEHGHRFAGSTQAAVNGYRTLVLLPDGSKEGWPDSEEGDALRDEFIDWLRVRRSMVWWDWVEVSLGEYGQAITRGNNPNRYAHASYTEEPFLYPGRIHEPDEFDEEGDVWRPGEPVQIHIPDPRGDHGPMTDHDPPSLNDLYGDWPDTDLGPVVHGTVIYDDLGPRPRRWIGRPLWALGAVLDRASLAVHALGRRPVRATYVRPSEPDPVGQSFQAMWNESGIFTVTRTIPQVDDDGSVR